MLKYLSRISMLSKSNTNNHDSTFIFPTPNVWGKTSVIFAHRKYHILIGMKTMQLGLDKNTLIIYLQNTDCFHLLSYLRHVYLIKIKDKGCVH